VPGGVLHIELAIPATARADALGGNDLAQDAPKQIPAKKYQAPNIDSDNPKQDQVKRGEEEPFPGGMTSTAIHAKYKSHMPAIISQRRG
jgi:hypothetical protein